MTPETEIKLHDYVQGEIGKVFEFGKHDCPLFVLGAMDIMTGDHRREEMTGLWHDQKSAWKYARKNGDICDHLKEYSFKSVDYQYMQTGDIVVMEQRLAHEKKWRSVAVCLGSKVAIMSEPNGVELIAIKDIPNMTEVMRWA
jgi:hypothetical protein